ncbi:reverse transcriptase domain-containing protein [Tanacetum coccineum]
MLSLGRSWCKHQIDASIHMEEALTLPELLYSRMILELANRSTTSPSGIAEDVFVKVGKFHFPADFVVVDYVVDPWVPLILGRPFLRMARALIDVYGEELTLRVDDEAITFKVGQTLRYSYNNAKLVNRIDVIDVSCEEYAQEVLGFLDSSKSGNPTSIDDPPDFDPEGDLLLLEKLLNDDPSSPLPPKELHFEEIKTIKSSIDDLPELELKDLPSHLEYAFLEGTDKLPVIISKELKDEEKNLMEDDFKPAIQHQRRVNPKIHEIIKKEVIKLFDAGLIYPISDSPWVSPVHCVPKKGGMTVVENEDNELIPTRLVTGWRVCIDYHKLNDATRKDHFPLPFMDQMLERLGRNEYYCFLDGFSRYFQISIDLQDQEKTTFTCPYGTFAYRRMPFGLCNAPGTFQRCMMAIFHDMIKETMEVFMDDFSVFGDSFSSRLSHLDKMLKWIEVDKAKVDVIAKLPHPTSVKGVLNDRGTHFCNDQFAKVMLKYGVTHRLSTAYHPQTSGQVEPSVTAIQDTIGCTPYKLVYGKACHLPIELEHKAYWALKHCNFDLKTAGDHRKVQMNELNELRDQAYENSLIYKEKTKKIHDSKIKNRVFNVGDQVSLFNSRLKIFSGKLKTRWTGPFTVAQVFPYGAVELSQTDGPNFKVNGHRLKHYFGGDIPPMVVPDLQTFPMDH